MADNDVGLLLRHQFSGNHLYWSRWFPLV